MYHDVFDQEKERLDLVENLPSQAWKNHPVQRSFDALRFVHIQDEGVMWKGMVATYPPLVPPEHVLAARLCRRRQILFEGQVAELPLTASPNAKYFAALSSQNGKGTPHVPYLIWFDMCAISHILLLLFQRSRQMADPSTGWDVQPG